MNAQPETETARRDPVPDLSAAVRSVVPDATEVRAEVSGLGTWGHATP